MKVDRKRAYRVWNGIKRRCYNPKDKYYNSYGGAGVRMCDEWLEFENFYKWYMDNYYTVEGEYMAVDKDILGGDSKVYSPETCIIVPFRINGLFVHKDNGKMRGLQKVGKRYQVKVRVDGINTYCGTYDTVEKASEVYRKCKEAVIYGVIEEYKDKIPSNVYNKLLTFKL